MLSMKVVLALCATAVAIEEDFDSSLMQLAAGSPTPTAYVGPMGTQCAEGEVMTEQECRAAATQLGFPFNYVMDYDGAPRGCLAFTWSDKTVFNSDPVGSSNPKARPVCSSSAPAATPAPASGTGDPHLQNMFGQRFDLARPGMFLLVSVPQGTQVEDALLVVQADARRLSAHCDEMYFQQINVTGTWADKAQPGGFHFDVRDARHEKPQWVHLGPMELKVAYGQTDKGARYLNVYVKHLGRAGFAVGGLLGEDDHSEAVVPTDGCLKTLTLSQDVILAD